MTVLLHITTGTVASMTHQLWLCATLPRSGSAMAGETPLEGMNQAFPGRPGTIYRVHVYRMEYSSTQYVGWHWEK